MPVTTLTELNQFKFQWSENVVSQQYFNSFLLCGIWANILGVAGMFTSNITRTLKSQHTINCKEAATTTTTTTTMMMYTFSKPQDKENKEKMRSMPREVSCVTHFPELTRLLYKQA